MHVHQAAHLLSEDYVQDFYLQYLVRVGPVLVLVWSISHKVLRVASLESMADSRLILLEALQTQLILNQYVRKAEN